MSEDFDGAMEDAPATEVRSLMFIVLLYSLFSLCQPFYGMDTECEKKLEFKLKHV